jgi:hypothetical protein
MKTIPQTKWKARTKHELMIEVWEALDCETVGAKELVAISEEVKKRFGEGAVESPVAIARLLADEGAELRHAEVLDLHVQWLTRDPYDAMFRNVLKFGNFHQAENSIKNLETLRKKFLSENDKKGLLRVIETAQKGKRRAEMISRNKKVDEQKREEKAEIAEWFTIWLKQPDVFFSWLQVRKRSKGFKEKFNYAES